MIDDAAREELKNRLTACTWQNTIGPHNLDYATAATIAEWAAEIFRKHFQPAPGIERPDAPGVWFNGKACVDVSYDAYGTKLWFQKFGDGCDYEISDLPPGNWRRAVPLPPCVPDTPRVA